MTAANSPEGDAIVCTLHYGSVPCVCATMGFKHRELDTAPLDHALCDVARLPVRKVVSAIQYITDLTLGLGEVVFDCLKDA